MKLHNKTKNIFGLFLVAVLAFSSISSFLQVNNASAAEYKTLNPSQKARSYAYYRAVNECVSSGIKTEIPADANFDGMRTDPANGYWYGTGDPSNPDRKGDWWSGDAKNTGTVSPYSGNPTGERGCSALTKTGLADYWNGVSPADLLKALNYKWNGTDKWVFQGGNRSDLFKAFLSSQGVSMEYTAPTEYFLNYNAFINKCNPKDLGPYSGLSDSIKNRVKDNGTSYTAYGGKTVYANLKIATETGTAQQGYTYEFGPTEDSRPDSANLLYEGNYKTCEQMATNISNKAEAYSDASLTYACTVKDNKDFQGARLIACKEGIKNKANTDFCAATYSDQSQKDACIYGQGVTLGSIVSPPKGNDDTKDGGETTTSCRVDGVGWIVCPVMTFLGGIVDGAYQFVSALLEVQPLFTTGGTAGVYNAWSTMRTISNVAFVIAFLVIIFSQLTGLGVSNYGVKKLLPRLVVAAILVNISFWVCAVAVDISNILGGSMRAAFDSVGNTIRPAQEFDGTATGQYGGWEVLTGTILAGTAVGISLYVGLSALIPALLSALVAIVTVFLVLTLRQALIILLIVIAPLAFVAYILPNTEDWFKRWRKLLTTLLLMYPIIALIFGASALASKIVMLGAEGNFAVIVQIMGALIAILPLAITPIVMKAAGGVLNRFAGIVNNAEKGPIDRLRKGGEQLRRNQEGKRRIRALSGGQVFGAGRFKRDARRKAIVKGIESEAARSEAGYVAKQAQGVDAFRNQLAGGSRLRSSGEAAGNRALANAINVEAKLEIDEVNAAKAVIENAQLNGSERQTLALHGSVIKDGKTYSSPIMQKAAIQEQLRTGSMGDVHAIVEESGSSLRDFRQTISQGVAANGHTAKNPALGGKTLDAIARGDIKSRADLDNYTLGAIKEGKFNAEAIATMHDQARQRALEVAANAAQSGDSSAAAELNKAAMGVMGSEILRNKLVGNSTAINQIEDMSKL